MAGRLSSRRRRTALCLLLIVLLVLLGHGLVGEGLQGLRADWDAGSSAPMPERLQVVFAREMKQSAPPAAVRRPRPAAPEGSAAPAAARPASSPASAPVEPERQAAAASAPAPELPASAPEPQPAVPPVADAASSAQPAASAALLAQDGEPGPEWPESAQLSYRLLGNYRGEVQGQGQVQWIRAGRRYQVHLDLTIGPSFAPLIARRMSSDGVLTPQGISPQRYDEDTRVVFRSRRRVSVFFRPQPEGGTEVQLGDGSLRQAARGVQDTSSQFVQLTWLFLTGREPLEPGRIIEMPLALPRKLYAWRYQVLGQEELQTPIGPLQTWHLQPLLQPGDKLGSDLKAEVWLAPTLQYLPVRLRITQDPDTFIDLSLDAPPLLKAP